MAASRLKVNGKTITIHKAVIRPEFGSKTVLVTDTWDYVAMWLRRNHKTEGLFYWEQAKHFFRATEQLPNTSSPLTAYYCFLNAVKTLLVINKIASAELHGLSGRTIGGRVSLSNEIVKFHGNGIAGALGKYLQEPQHEMEFSLKDLLYNLPYIHRAFNLTFRSQPELFVPILETRFVRKKGSTESWFRAEIRDPKYKTLRTLNKLSDKFERDYGVDDGFVMRRKSRFRWNGTRLTEDNLNKLTEYHRKLRFHVQYICGPERLWYLKRTKPVTGLIDRTTLSITFWAMHRVSELARYTPMILAKHFESGHNWLISEFISTALHQFIDEISSEITGQEFMVPGRR